MTDFTYLPSGTRRFLPERFSLHRWGTKRLSWRRLNLLAIGIILFIAAVLAVT